jgi:alkylation response protein AidB-like acyl-CoA dehydrogenase
MTLTLCDDEAMLAESARRVLTRAAPISAFRALRDSGAVLRYNPALLTELASCGFVAPHVPEAEGGTGLGVIAAGLIAEQLGHTLAAAPLLSAAVAASLVVALGSDAQRAELLPKLTLGEWVVAVGLDELPRHDPSVLATTAASTTGPGWTLRGAKCAVSDAVGAQKVIISALADNVPALFLVDLPNPGVELKPLSLVDSRNAADITLADAAAVRLGSADATESIAAALDLGRALLAAELLGIADEAFDRTVAYLKEREQFGRKIGAFQALQHRCARLYARLDIARGVVIKALRAIDAGDPQRSALASLSKAVLTKLARDVLVDAVQLHGGIGVTDELDIGLLLKRARAAGDLLGDDYFHTERLAAEHWGL